MLVMAEENVFKIYTVSFFIDGKCLKIIMGNSPGLGDPHLYTFTFN